MNSFKSLNLKNQGQIVKFGLKANSSNCSMIPYRLFPELSSLKIDRHNKCKILQSNK
jgi:hypothetical protein